MPIYEFICRDCQKGFEKLTSQSERDKAECPACGSAKTLRTISLTAPAQLSSGSKSAIETACGSPNCCGGGYAIPNCSQS